MSGNTVIETVNGNIKIVSYNKPRRKNGIDIDMYLKITKILNDAAQNDDIAVTVLTGTGDFYSSGNDIVASMEVREGFNLLSVLRDFIEAFVKFPKLLIAIVNGPAVGIAATTLPLCDLVFAIENAYFYTPFTKLGIVAEACSTLTFPRIMGDRKAIEMLLFNHKMSAQEALDCGFVNYLYKPEEIQTKVWNKIIEVSKLPPKSVTASKRLLRSNIQDLLATNKRELEELSATFRSEENIIAIKEFFNRRSKL